MTGAVVSPTAQGARGHGPSFCRGDLPQGTARAGKSWPNVPKETGATIQASKQFNTWASDGTWSRVNAALSPWKSLSSEASAAQDQPDDVQDGLQWWRPAIFSSRAMRSAIGGCVENILEIP